MKKRILFLLQLPPPTYGAAIVGQEIRDSKLINETFDATYLNIVLTRDLNHPEPAFSRLARYLSLFFKLLGILLTRRFDLCYLAITCHGVAFLKDSLFVLLCKLFCKRIVIHQHNKGMSADADKPVFKTLFRLVYKNTKVILLSEHLYDDISAHVGKDQILICPNGSPTSINPGDIPVKKSVPPHLVFLSNLFFDKGIITFLNCCSILKKQGMRFSADIIGSETLECDRNLLQKEITARDLSANVIYHGRQTGIERNRILSAGNYFLFPTKYKNEAFPLVVLEAMQFQMLCLSTPVGGIMDLIEDGTTGFLCNPDDAAGFANRILQMESDHALREKITGNAWLQYQEKYTLKKFEENMCRCLNNTMDESNERTK